MSKSKYEAQKLAEEKVKSFNPKEHEGCPCCGNEAFATWKPDEDDDPLFFIRCTSCSCRVSSYSWVECLDDWEGHRESDDI